MTLAADATPTTLAVRGFSDLVRDGIGFRTPLLDLYRNTSLHSGTAA